MDIPQFLQNATMPVLVTALFLWYMVHSDRQRAENDKSLEEQRTENARLYSKEQREHQATINRLWASTLKDITDTVTESNNRVIESNERIIAVLGEHEKASQERYKRQGTTQDLIDAVRELKKP